MYTVSTSLYSFSTERNENVKKEFQKHELDETKLLQFLDVMEGREWVWIGMARWQFCRKHLPQDWCNVFHRLQIASWALMGAIIFTVCCLVMGVVSGFSFYYLKPRREQVVWATAYVIAAPIVAEAGAIQYYFMTRDFGDLVNESGWTFGWPFIAASVLSVLTWIPCVLMIGFALRDEDDGVWETLANAELGYGAVIERITERFTGRWGQSETDEDRGTLQSIAEGDDVSDNTLPQFQGSASDDEDSF